MDSGYELFDHTADIGVRVHAPTLGELLAPATAGLYAVIGEVAGTGQAERVQIDLAGHDPALLLRDYLAELLRLFETKHQVATAVEPGEFTHARLTATVSLSAIDAERSDLVREAKAVTYHHLELRPVDGGYQATYIVDI